MNSKERWEWLEWLGIRQFAPDDLAWQKELRRRKANGEDVSVWLTKRGFLAVGPRLAVGKV